jgi:membrane glycosyltransferase
VHSLFPDWPIDLSFEAMLLFSLSMALVLVPKVLGVIELSLVRREELRAMGGLLRVVLSSMVELVFSTLLAPLLMLHQSSFVLDILAGRHSGWLPQQREADSIRWSAAMAVSLYPVVVGLCLGGTTLVLAPDVLTWSAPVLAAMIGSPLTTWIVCRTDTGRAMRWAGLLTIPEEGAPPSALVEAAQPYSFALPPARTTDPQGLLADSSFMTLHLAMLRATGSGEPAAAALWERWLAGSPLTPAERGQVLADQSGPEDVLRKRLPPL